MKKSSWFLSLLLAFVSLSVFAGGTVVPKQKSQDDVAYPFYVGVLSGYGDTTWGELVSDDSTTLIALATPVKATDHGPILGVMAGYQVNPNFALESTFVHFSDTKVRFLDFSFYSPVREFNTRTTAFSVVGKFMVPVKRFSMSPYADAGLSLTHRKDILANKYQVGAEFGLGVVKDITKRFFADASFQFQTGYAVSELRPADDFIPFLLSGQLRLGYRFNPFRHS